MITKFNEFINEGRGISDVVKAYTKYLYERYVETDGENEQVDFEFEPLMLTDLRVYYKLGDKYGGKFDPSKSFFNDSGELCNLDLKITINKNDIVSHKIKGVLSHELTHTKEYYDIMLKLHKFGIKIEPNHVRIQKLISSFTDDKCKYYTFIYLLYLTLDNEMNARISQVYDYLLEFNSLDADFLFEQLKKHKNWEYLVMLSSFDYNKFVDENITEIELGGLLEITKKIQEGFKDKLLNKNTKILKFIDSELNNINDLYEFYKNWSNYFKDRTIKHEERFKYLIKEVIEDLKGNRPWNENYRHERQMLDEKRHPFWN